MSESYFTTADGVWFQPTPHARGPWDVNACHGGPPSALIVRAVEQLVPEKRLARLSVDIERPIPMAGFRVEAQLVRSGRAASRVTARLLDDDRVYARASSLLLRTTDDFEGASAPVDPPSFAQSVPGPFPIEDTVHGEEAFPNSLEVRYDPGSGVGGGGPTTMWMRTVAILAGEEASGVQRMCPLADSGNGISYNAYVDEMLFINADLQLSLVRDPVGEWFCSRATSHWAADGTGLSVSVLFDISRHVGLATQSLLLSPL